MCLTTEESIIAALLGDYFPGLRETSFVCTGLFSKFVSPVARLMLHSTKFEII